jgi:hypothetical protein
MRLIQTDKEALGVWKRLADSFSVWRLIAFGTLGSRSVMPYRKDNLGWMLATSRWKIGLGLLGGLDDAQIDFLERYAAINARRVEHVFRAWALLLVSLPIGAFLAFEEFAPEWLDAIGFDVVATIAAIIGSWAVFAGVMMAAAWRARDLHDIISFEQARRLHEQAKAVASE